MAELKSHQLAPDNGVRRFPWFGLKIEQEKFNGQTVLMCLKPGINPVSVGLEEIMCFWRHSGVAAFRQAIKTKCAGEAIDLDHGRTNHFRKTSLSRTTLHLHLKKTFTSMDVAQSAGRIIHVLGKDVGHTMS